MQMEKGKMIKLKPEYKIQRKIGKSKNWKITFWENIEDALEKYPNDIFRKIKIHRSYEVVK